MICSHCRTDLPDPEFNPSAIGRGRGFCRACMNSTRRAYRKSDPAPRPYQCCLWCGADLGGRRRHAKFCSQACSMKHWHASHPGQHRWYTLKTKYGIDESAFGSMLAGQGGGCAICGALEDGQWNVDHDHRTGRVRGILCSQCNLGIGLLRDDPDLMRRAIGYLETGRQEDVA